MEGHPGRLSQNGSAKLRILHTAESYTPEVCGVQQTVQSISEGLAARGHQVTVATGWHPERDFKSLNGVTIEQFKVSGKWMRGFRGEKQKYQRFVRSFGCDVMMNYAGQSWATNLVFPLLDGLDCVRVLVPSGYSTLDNWKWWPFYLLLPRWLRRYDQVVYLSDNGVDKQFGDRHGTRHYSIIPNGVPEEEFATPTGGFRQAYGISTAHMFLCVATHYSEMKGQEMALRAYLEAGVPDTTLVFISLQVNDYVSRLRRILAEYDLPENTPSIRFLERVPRHLIVSAFHEADLFLYGSKLESGPRVILEAMASRTPFISTPVGYVPKMPGGVVVSSAEHMAQAIRRLAGKGPEWQQLARSGRRAWEESYTCSKTVDQYEQLYLRLYRDRLASKV